MYHSRLTEGHSVEHAQWSLNTDWRVAQSIQSATACSRRLFCFSVVHLVAVEFLPDRKQQGLEESSNEQIARPALLAASVVREWKVQIITGELISNLSVGGILSLLMEELDTRERRWWTKIGISVVVVVAA